MNTRQIAQFFSACVFCLVFDTQTLYAQNISFRHLTIDDGLSQNAVLSILQDHKGFMWFGTKDGLNRYDGYSFTTYRHDPFDTTSISSSYVTALFEDSRGYIWVGTFEGGVSLFQRDNEKFRSIQCPAMSATSKVTSIVEDSAGVIWIGTDGDGIFRLSINPEHPLAVGCKQIVHDQGTVGSLSSNTVTTMHVDSRGILWAGTDRGLDRFLPEHGTFEHFDIRTKHPKAPSTREQNTAAAICESRSGDLWLGTASGLVKFETTDGTYKLFPHHYEVYRYGWGIIRNILEDDEGKLWLATPGELMRFDPANASYDYYRNDPFDPGSLTYNVVSNLSMDRTGILWIGTDGGGINVYDRRANRFSTLVRKKDASSRVAGFSVRSVLEDNTGHVWISTDVLYRWNRKSGELKSFETTSNRPDDFGNTGAWSMIQASTGLTWFATSQGLYGYVPSTGRIRQYKFNPDDLTGLREKDVYGVFEDRGGNIWVATESYLSKLIDADNGLFRHIRYRQAPSAGERISPVMCADGTGLVWLGTGNGLLRFNQIGETFKIFINNPARATSLSNNTIKSICLDPQEPNRILWIGTGGGGLNRFDTRSETFKHFTDKDGLPNNVVYGILPDKRGHLWLSTNKGLSRFNLRTHEFRNYDVHDGLQSNEFNTGAYFGSKSGEMFFGGINGLNYFHPDAAKDNPHVPEVVLTGLKLDNREVSPNETNSVLTKVISETNSLILPPHVSIITFEFAALGFSATGKNQYAYKLENFNSDWITSGPVRSATYTNVPQGTYIFRVKGSNNDGVWNEKGVFLELIIMPPWWRTWWAYAIYGLAVVGLLYILRRYEMNRIRLKNSLELETIEAVKLKELDRMKSRFFANISHEFRTPLTLILGQVDSVMTSNIDTKEKGKLQVALRNARRLLQLINQLLDLSKIEAGSMELRADRHNLISFLKNVVYSFESLAEQKNISLKFESEKQNIVVLLEQDKMEKVFYNLLSNAFKFTPDGGQVSVGVKLTRSRIGEREKPKTGESEKRRVGASPIPLFSDSPTPSSSEFVQVTVRDTGIGISPDQIPHIFDRFYQVDNSQTREHEGTGIGLALTKELVELHHGSISVTSKQEEGTEFVVCLPIDTTEPLIESRMDLRHPLAVVDEHEEMERKPQSQPARTGKKISGEIVLIVEDNADVRAYIREQLENSYRIIEAANGQEGVVKAQEVIPDLIITDVMMPKMDGYQFARKIRGDEKTSHIPIVMLTAKAALDDKIEGLEKGVDVYLTKPFSSKELKVQVKNLITRREELRRRFSTATIIKPSEVTATSIDKAFLEKIIKCIEIHFEDENFDVERLASEASMSISQLNRKLHALIDQPAGELIRSMRLQRASDLLKQNAGTVAEISYKLGFTDQAYFSRAFKKQFGHTPSEYKKQSGEVSNESEKRRRGETEK